MMTKTQFANMIVNDFCKDNDVDRADAHIYIAQSSRLAVALETLGELNETEMAYSRTRGGTEFVYTDDATKDVAIMSTRELLAMLPD